MAYGADAHRQGGGRAAEVATRNAALDAQAIDVHLASPARHRDLFARNQDEARLLQRGVASRTREQIVIGQRQELIAVTSVPSDGRLGATSTIAEPGVGVDVALLEMRNVERAGEARLHRSIDRRVEFALEPRLDFRAKADAAEQAQRANQSRSDAPA